MLYPERDANNGHETNQRQRKMTDSEPDSGQYEPDYISDGAEYACADITIRLNFSSIDGLISEWEERKLSNGEAGLAPRDSDNGDERYQSNKPPSEPHKDSTKYKPDDISKCSHIASSNTVWTHYTSGT